METFAAIAGVFALFLVQRFVYGFDHRWMLGRYDALVRHVAENRTASGWDPLNVIGSGWPLALWGTVGMQLGFAMLWLILADTRAEPGVRLAAHLAAFLTATGVVGLLYEALLLYLRLRRLLRQAEAD